MMKKLQKTKEKQKEESGLSTGNLTQDLNSEDINKRITAKRDKLYGIHASIAVYGMTGLTLEQKAKGRELEDRLHYRTLVAEESLLNDKIELYNELLRVLKK